MRFAVVCLIALACLPACERKSAETSAPAPVLEAVDAPISDELPGLPAAATGVAFWDHPTLSFNSTLIVATSDGVVAYNMEDGNEVARIDEANADGVATGYLGFGTSAVGFIAFLDAEENAFRFFGVDNASRAFLPLDPGPAMRGDVRGFCLGRGAGASAPSLFVVQRDGVQVFNLAASSSGVAVESETNIDSPENLASCAVGAEGELFVASDKGDIFKLNGGNPFASPFAKTLITNGELGVISSASEDDPSEVSSQLIIADLSTGVMQLFDTENGAALGAVKIVATDDLPGVDGGEAFGVTGGNLGGLYRNGVAAFGVAAGADGPVIRLAPVSSLKNALSIPVGEPVSPRGEPPMQEDDFLSIPTNFEPE